MSDIRVSGRCINEETNTTAAAAEIPSEEKTEGEQIGKDEMWTEASAVTVAAVSSSVETPVPAYSEASERLDRRSLIGLLIFCGLAVAGAVLCHCL